MLESRESQLVLWELLLLRYPRWKLTYRPIAVDEILPELRQVLDIFQPGQRKSTFKIWQRMRLWPPPEILNDVKGQEIPEDAQTKEPNEL